MTIDLSTTSPVGRRRHDEGVEPIETWSISRRLHRADETEIDDCWAASPSAGRHWR